MNGTVSFSVAAEARAGLLCKLVGLFAQLDLPAPALSVTVEGETMRVEAQMAHFGDALVAVVARKMAGFVGVERVTVEQATPIGELAEDRRVLEAV